MDGTRSHDFQAERLGTMYIFSLHCLIIRSVCTLWCISNGLFLALYILGLGVGALVCFQAPGPRDSAQSALPCSTLEQASSGGPHSNRWPWRIWAEEQSFKFSWAFSFRGKNQWSEFSFLSLSVFFSICFFNTRSKKTPVIFIFIYLLVCLFFMGRRKSLMDQMDRVIRKKKSDQGVHGESYSTIRPII